MVSACGQGEKHNETPDAQSLVSTNLEVDHFNIWVKNPIEAKRVLENIGFTAVPDSLSAIHHGQGTSGRFFYFLNGYLELIFVYDEQEFKQNCQAHPHMDFDERANFSENGACPFSIALKVEDYDEGKIPLEAVKYQQEWMHEGRAIYAAKSSKEHLFEPSVFFVYPEIQSDILESFDDLQFVIPDDQAIWRSFFKHRNGAEKITSITISSIGLDENTETIEVLNNLEKLQLEPGSSHLIEVEFDNNRRNQRFDLRPELPLIVRL